MKQKFVLSRKAAEWAVVFGLLCAVFVSAADFDASCEELRDNVLRLHIIANSDSPQDQELKLKVRDAILSQSGNLFENDGNLEDALITAGQSLDMFCQTAEETIRAEGYDYRVTAEIGEAYFETREYEDFTLPAGNYQSLIINIGESRGKNWWCVIFPQVCIPAASDASLSDSVGQDGVEIAEHPNRYVMKFKTVEIYENIKRLFQKD